MRNLYDAEVNRYRDTSRQVLEHWGTTGDETCGLFFVPSPSDGKALKVIASAGAGWDHVSVSRDTRCPNWPEMEHVKRLFFLPDEVAMQLHVPISEHISVHPFCLHIWRPQAEAIPMPPAWTVA